MPDPNNDIMKDIPAVSIPTETREVAVRRVKKFNIRNRMEKLNRALLQSVKADDVTRIARAMVDSAQEGDVKAAQLIFDRVLGKVAQQIDFNDVTERKTAGELIQEVMREYGR